MSSKLSRTKITKEESHLSLFTINTIFWSSVFGGILSGFFMAAYNFQTLKKKSESLGMIIHGLIACIFVAISALFLSKVVEIPLINLATPFLFAIYAKNVINSSQGDLLNKKFALGFDPKGVFDAIFVIVPALIIQFVIIMVLIFTLSSFGLV